MRCSHRRFRLTCTAARIACQKQSPWPRHRAAGAACSCQQPAGQGAGGHSARVCPCSNRAPAERLRALAVCSACYSSVSSPLATIGKCCQLQEEPAGCRWRHLSALQVPGPVWLLGAVGRTVKTTCLVGSSNVTQVRWPSLRSRSFMGRTCKTGTYETQVPPGSLDAAFRALPLRHHYTDTIVPLTVATGGLTDESKVVTCAPEACMSKQGWSLVRMKSLFSLCA